MSNTIEDNGGGIVRPDPKMFDRQDVAPGILYKGARFHVFERAEYPADGGILCHYKGMKYPKKGFPYPEAVMAVNMLKKNLKTALSVVGKATVIPLVVFAILPWGMKKKALARVLGSYVELADNIFVSHYLQPDRYCKAAKEVWRFMAIALNTLGFPPGLSDGAGRIMATVLEYDDSYRYYVQDLARETSKERMVKAPAAEMLRLGQLFYDRDGEWVTIRSRRVGIMVRGAMKMAGWALIHPKLRKAFIAGVQVVDFGRLALDDGDWYHCLMRNNYHFGGLTFEERRAMYCEIHKDGFPPEIEVVEDTEPQTP